METTFDYLRAHAVELGSRILETYPPLQSTKDPVAPALQRFCGKLSQLRRSPSPAPRSICAGPKLRGSWPNAELARPTWLWAQSMCWRMGGPVPRW